MIRELMSGHRGCFAQTSWPWDSSTWWVNEEDRSNNSWSKLGTQMRGLIPTPAVRHRPNKQLCSALMVVICVGSALRHGAKSHALYWALPYTAGTDKIHPCSFAMDATESSNLTGLALAINDHRAIQGWKAKQQRQSTQWLCKGNTVSMCTDITVLGKTQ